MPILKRVKEISENIKQEQLDNQLTNIERLEDWEERFVEQTEQLHQIEEDLENKTKEAERLNEGFLLYIKKSLEEKKELEQQIEALEKKDESKQISLLKEIHQKEISEIEERHKFDILVYGNSLESAIEKRKENEELKKELEEKELLIEELKEKNRLIELSEKANLSGIRVAEKWGKMRENELDKKIGELENAGNGLLKQLHEENERNKDLKEYIEKLEKKLYEQGKSLKEESKRNADQKVEIEYLEEQVDLVNELYLNKIPLPKIPNKLKIFKEKTKTKFQHLIEKTKQKSQELIARIEVRVK